MGEGGAVRYGSKSLSDLGGGAGFVGGGDTVLRGLVLAFRAAGCAISKSVFQGWLCETRARYSGSTGDSSGVRRAAGIVGGVPGLVTSCLGRAKFLGGDFLSVCRLSFSVGLKVNPATRICSSSPYGGVAAARSGENASKLLAALVLGLGPPTLLSA
jgi:hypothetical protein